LVDSWTIHLLYALVMSKLPAWMGAVVLDLSPDVRVFCYTLLLSVATGIAFGLVPALQACGPDLTPALKDEVSASPLWHASASRSLVAGQFAVCLVLLISAGLLARGLRRAQTIDQGFEIEHVLAAELYTGRLYDATKAAEFYQRLLERLRALPGVKSASLTNSFPLVGSRRTSVAAEGGAPAAAGYNIVSPSYFETLGIRIVRGRNFTEGEARTGAPVVIISEATARRFWPGEDAVGKHVSIGVGSQPGRKVRDAGPVSPSSEVIGVARDIQSMRLSEIDAAYLYLPTGRWSSYPDLLIRTEGDPAKVVGSVRGELRALNPDLRADLEPIREALRYQILPAQAGSALSTALGLLALLLASVGIYGVVSYAVSRRTREIGIRVALGASRSDIMRLVLGQSLRVVAIGIGLGMIGAASVSRALSALLFGVSPLDPVTYLGVSLLLAAVAMLASYVPARRAMRVDPVVALRCE
jgi:predicted permease